MKKYYAYRVDDHGEKWTWEDREDTVIVSANSTEEAAKIFRACVNPDFAELLEEYIPPVEIKNFEEWEEYNPYWTEWRDSNV